MNPDTNYICPGCGLTGGNGDLVSDVRCNASQYCWDMYHELTLYTLSLGDTEFIHQHVIDAYAAQHSSPEMKGIQICFALIGLYLYLERDYSGRAVQQVHAKLAARTKDWPCLTLDTLVTGITVYDVLTAEPGAERHTLIRQWAEIVWHAWRAERERVVEMVRGM